MSNAKSGCSTEVCLEVLQPGRVVKKTIPKPHWYLRVVYECPACGGGEEYRLRMYTPRPLNYQARVEYHPHFDNCIAL